MRLQYRSGPDIDDTHFRRAWRWSRVLTPDKIVRVAARPAAGPSHCSTISHQELSLVPMVSASCKHNDLIDLELLFATVRHGRKGNLWFRQRFVGSALGRGRSTVNLQVPILLLLLLYDMAVSVTGISSRYFS